MKRIVLAVIVEATLSALLAICGASEVFYTQVNVSIPTGGYYNIDLNHDGVVDFTLRAPLLEGRCQFGDEDVWYLDVTSANLNSVVTPANQVGSDLASALQGGVVVGAGQRFDPGSSVLAELYWGACDNGSDGQWLNLPDRYLGLQFRGLDHAMHYGWAKLSTVAYVDRQGTLHSNTFVSGLAYETVPGQAIRTGQTTN